MVRYCKTNDWQVSAQSLPSFLSYFLNVCIRAAQTHFTMRTAPWQKKTKQLLNTLKPQGHPKATKYTYRVWLTEPGGFNSFCCLHSKQQFISLHLKMGRASCAGIWSWGPDEPHHFVVEEWESLEALLLLPMHKTLCVGQQVLKGAPKQPNDHLRSYC